MRVPDVRLEWRLTDVERKAENAFSRLYELDSLRSEMGRLECTNRDFSSSLNELRSEFEMFQEKLRSLEEGE